MTEVMCSLPFLQGRRKRSAVSFLAEKCDESELALLGPPGSSSMVGHLQQVAGGACGRTPLTA